MRSLTWRLMQALTDLGLSGNHLTALPSSISQLAALQKLACNGNSLQQLPPDLTGLTSLKQLWLQRNCLSSINPVAGLPVRQRQTLTLVCALHVSPPRRSLRRPCFAGANGPVCC